MSKTVSLLWTLCTICLFGACAWVDDDLSDCPEGNWVQLSYTYNMLDAEAAFTQVRNASLFVLDQTGICVDRQELDSLSLQRNHYLVRLPSLPEGDYDVLVWAGLADSNYRYTADSLVLFRPEGVSMSKLPALFHGRLEKLHIDDEYRVSKLSLVKNTNTLSCIFQCLSDKSLVTDDFRLELWADNAVFDHWNIPIATQTTCYLPYYQEVDQIEDIRLMHSALNTLRLMEGDGTRLRLIYLPLQQTIFDIPLTSYLLLSRNAHVDDMPAQEYLDRQDQYNLLFLLQDTGNDHQPYLCVQVEVNGWIVRFHDVELD